MLLNSVPKDEPASLVFLTQTEMRRINANNGSLIERINATDVSAIEIWHRNRTVCAMYSSPWTTVVMKCHRIDSLNSSWTMPLPEIITSTHCKWCSISFVESRQALLELCIVSANSRLWFYWFTCNYWWRMSFGWCPF